MGEVFDQLLPVGTLVLGTGLGWLVQRGDARRIARIEAGDLLAELYRPIWTKGDDEDWVDLQVYLGKLRVRLAAADVPAPVAAWVSACAHDHWSRVEFLPEEGSNVVHGDAPNRLREATAAAHLWLYGRWRPVKRWKAIRRAQEMKGLT